MKGKIAVKIYASSGYDNKIVKLFKNCGCLSLTRIKDANRLLSVVWVKGLKRLVLRREKKKEKYRIGECFG